MSIRRSLAGAISLLCALASVASARALPSLTLGFSSGASPYVASGNPTADAPWIARAKAVGAQMIRVAVRWSAIAPAVRPAGFVASDPASPGYNWTILDAQIRELTSAGFTILVNVSLAPSWAEGPHQPRNAPPGTWRPSPEAFGAFATAISQHATTGTTRIPQRPERHYRASPTGRRGTNRTSLRI